MFCPRLHGYAAHGGGSRTAPVLSVRVLLCCGTAADRWRSAVSPASTAAGYSSGPPGTYTPPWPGGGGSHRCKWNQNNPYHTPLISSLRPYPDGVSQPPGHPLRWPFVCFLQAWKEGAAPLSPEADTSPECFSVAPPARRTALCSPSAWE